MNKTENTVTLPPITSQPQGETAARPDNWRQLAAIAEEAMRDEKYRDPAAELARRLNESGE